jgi:hypothetical protein
VQVSWLGSTGLRADELILSGQGWSLQRQYFFPAVEVKSVEVFL